MKKPLYRAVVDLMKAKVQMTRVSQLQERELFELGNLLRISQWDSPEDIVITVRHLTEIRSIISSEGDTKAAYSFLELLVRELEAEAVKMMPKPANHPRGFLFGMHPE